MTRMTVSPRRKHCRGMSTGEFVFILSLLLNLACIYILAGSYLHLPRFGLSTRSALADHLSDVVVPAGKTVERQAVSASEHALSDAEKGVDVAKKKIDEEVKKP